MSSASPDARESGLRGAGVWAGSSAERASWRAARASAPGCSPSSASDQAARTPAASRAACMIAAGSVPAARSCWRTRWSSIVQRCQISARRSTPACRSAADRGSAGAVDFHSTTARCCACSSWPQLRRSAGRVRSRASRPPPYHTLPRAPCVSAGKPDGVADDHVGASLGVAGAGWTPRSRSRRMNSLSSRLAVAQARTTRSSV